MYLREREREETVYRIEEPVYRREEPVYRRKEPGDKRGVSPQE